MIPHSCPAYFGARTKFAPICFKQSPRVLVRIHIHPTQLIISRSLAIIFSQRVPSPSVRDLISSLAHEMADQSGSTRFRDLFDSALRAYEKETGITLANHRLALELQHCDTIEGITALLQDQAKDFRKPEKITKSVEIIVSILTPLSSAASLPDTIGLVRQKVLVASFTSLTVSYSHSPPRRSFKLVSVSYLMYMRFFGSYVDILVITK